MGSRLRCDDMKKEVYKIDDNGIYVETVLIECKYDEDNTPIWNVPADCVDLRIPDGLYQPIKWTGNEWVSTRSQEEIKEIENAPKPLTEIEKIRLEMARSNTELFETMLLMNGGA